MMGKGLAWALLGTAALGLGACANNSGSDTADGGSGESTTSGFGTGTGTTGAGGSLNLSGIGGSGTSTTLATATTTTATTITTSASTTTAVTTTAATSTTAASTGTTGTSTGASASTGTTGLSTHSTSHTSSTGASSSTGDAGCYSPPTGLFKETTAGVYCPFSDTGDGGAAVTCAAAQHCCEPPESANTPSTCLPAATACPVAKSTDWFCEGAPDCAAMTGTVCCGTGTIKEQAPQPTCGDAGYPEFPYVSDFTGATCQATCSTFQICSQTSECSGGKICVPIEPKGNAVGYCK